MLHLVLLLLLHGGAAQDDVQITTVPVAGPVSMLVGQGGNIGVSAGPDGLLIVDDQFAPLAPKIQAALDALAPSEESPLEFVLNTHWHGDHTGGNVVFGTQAPIIAHDNVRKRLASGGRTAFGEVEPAPEDSLPVVTFAESLSIHFNGEEIKVIHLPGGHTDGDCYVWFTGSNVVHLGDHFFAGRFPFVDLDSGGSVAGLARNVAQLIATLPPDVKIIPGHGPLSTLEDLRAYHRVLEETTSVVRDALAGGKSVDQIESEGLLAAWAEWGTGFISMRRWIEIVARSIEQEGASR